MPVSITVPAMTVTRVGIARQGDNLFNYGPGTVWFGVNEVMVSPSTYQSTGWAVAPNKSIPWTISDGVAFAYAPQSATVSIGAAGAPLGPALPWTYKQLSIANPAAGANFSVVLGNPLLWQVVEVGYVLTTSAAGPTREPVLSFISNSTEVAYSPSNFAHGASATVTYRHTRNPAFTALNSVVHAPLDANLILLPGSTIQCLTFPSIQAGDQYSNIFVAYREYQQYEPQTLT